MENVFCDGYSLITSQKTNEQLTAKLRHLLKFNYINSKFKNSNFSNSNFNKNDYLITVKLKVITSYYLLVTKLNNKFYSVFIDMSDVSKVYSVKFRFSEELYEKDTLMTGDFYLNDRNLWCFYIDNINLNNVIFTERLVFIYDLLKKDYYYDDYLNVCHLEIKPFFLHEHLTKKSSVSIDGFIYTPLDCRKPRIFISLSKSQSLQKYPLKIK